MKILDTLRAEKTSAKKKLAAVVALVTAVRAKYGNTDAEIQAPKVHTSEGSVNIALLGADERVAIAAQEIKEIIALASVVTEATEGSIFDRTFESHVAVNPVLCNLEQESASDY